MRLDFEYTVEEKAPFDEDFLREIARMTIEAAAIPSFAHKTVSLSAIAVTEEKIRELNRTYRSHDTVTDILSFGEYTDTEAIIDEHADVVFIGELFFSPAFIGRAAHEDGVSDEHEMAFIFSHGVLHLLGFDHSDEMFALQDQVTESFLDRRDNKKAV